MQARTKVIALSLVLLFIGSIGAVAVSAQNATTAPAVNTNVQPAVALATPVLVSPANNTILYDYPRTLTLAWKPVTGANWYSVETQYYDGKWEPYKNATVTGVHATSYTFQFVGDQPGRWRVIALDSTGAHSPSAFSAWRYFSFKTAGIGTLATPTLTTPSNNTTFYNYPRNTTLVWKPVPGATGYRVEVQQYDPGYARWISLSNVTLSPGLSASYTFSFGAANPGRWRVTALDSTHTFYASAPSAWRYFAYAI